ncbi:hypothetical protein H4F17_16160 [Vibrio cholerae]
MLLALMLFSFTLTVIFKGLNANKWLLLSTLVLFLILTYFSIVTLISSSLDGGWATQYISIISMMLIIFIGWTSVRNCIFSFFDYALCVSIALCCYILLKLLFTVLIFLGYIEIGFLYNISSDMRSLGYIGVGGLHRLTSTNEFFIPFVYFIVDIFNIKHKRLLKVILLIGLITSFTRSLWAVFGLLYLFKNMRSVNGYKQLLFFSISLIIGLYSLETFTQFKVITSINHRLFVEGSTSSEEKLTQIKVLSEELAKYPIHGKGVGTYVEDYIRNERLKYGYEVSWLVYAFQFGLPILSLIILMVLSPVLTRLIVNFRSLDLFLLVSFVSFLSIGFTNPILISLLVSCLYLLFYICPSRSR